MSSNPIFQLLVSQILKNTSNIDVKSLKEDLKNINIEQSILDLLSSFNITEKEPNTTLEALIKHYLSQINEHFIHVEKRTKYLLVDIINLKSTDQQKFPVSVVYFDKQQQTKWCRPLVDFHSKFKQVI